MSLCRIDGHEPARSDLAPVVRDKAGELRGEVSRLAYVDRLHRRARYARPGRPNDIAIEERLASLGQLTDEVLDDQRQIVDRPVRPAGHDELLVQSMPNQIRETRRRDRRSALTRRIIDSQQRDRGSMNAKP